MAKGKKKKAASRKAKAGYALPKPGPVSLAAFLKGQRKINGSFYEILDKLMDTLGAISEALGGASESAAKGKRSKAGPLTRTRKLVEGVPVIDPPGCVPPPPPPGGGG